MRHQEAVQQVLATRRGEYRLRSTGEVVVDPDYVAKWVIKEPKPDGEDWGGMAMPR